MAIFAVVTTSPQPALIQRIEATFGNNSLKLNDMAYLIATPGTAVELSARLGIYDPRHPTEPPIGSAVILATSAYFGRAPTSVWDWMKARLEMPPNG